MKLRSVVIALFGACGVAVLLPRPVPVIGTVLAAEHLTVMSFNIRYGTARDGDNAWEYRRDAVIELIDTSRVDVLGVQEALHFQLEEIANAIPRYRRIGVGRDDGAEAGEYSAILIDSSRLEVLEEGTFWFSDTPDVAGSTSWGNDIPRICTWARLQDIDSGRSFSVYNVHWDHRSQPSRERAAELLIERIGRNGAPADPVIVTGDFNAGEGNLAFRYLLESDGALAIVGATFRCWRGWRSADVEPFGAPPPAPSLRRTPRGPATRRFLRRLRHCLPRAGRRRDRAILGRRGNGSARGRRATCSTNRW